jgi:CAAX prenyl protease-like protein
MSQTEATTEPARSPASFSAIVQYAAPMFAYVALTAIEGYIPAAAGRPSPLWYPLAYAAKIAVVAVLMWVCRSAWRDLWPAPGIAGLGLSVGLGLGVTVLWVGLDGHYPTFAISGNRAAFDPAVLALGARWAFIAVRLLGLVVLVPVFEELFWRSFLIRWLIADDFKRVPIGRVTPTAAVVSSVFFGAVHPEWLPGVLTGLAWAWLLWRTKSLSACVVSHAVSNLALGVYVLAAGAWKFW